MRMQAIALCAMCLLPALESKAQTTFIYTNDDIFAGFGSNTVSGFSINPNGSLSKLAGSPFLTQGSGDGGNGFTSARRIAISLDGRFLFAANDGSGDVSSFSVDPGTGSLTLVAGSPFSTGGNGGGGISLAVSPDGRFLYASNTNSSNISVMQVNNGQLQLLGPPVQVAAGTFPVDLRVTANGKYLAVTIGSFSGGLVGIYNIAPDGSLSQVSGSPFSDGNPPGGFTDSLDSNCAANLLFVLNNSGLPLVDVFSIGSSGALSPIPGSPFTTPGTGGGTLYLSPDETRLFVGNQQNSISVFSVAAGGGLVLVPGSPFAANGGAFLSGLTTDRASKFIYGAGFNNRVVALTINADGSLSPVAGSPFAASQSAFSGLESLATYPPKTCTLTVNILIKPGSSQPAPINLQSQGVIPVAILSQPGFSAPTEVDTQSLTFGHSGTEQSFAFCNSSPEDVNGDGLPDLVCQFQTQSANFQIGDTQGILKGRTVGQRPLTGAGPIVVVPE